MVAAAVLPGVVMPQVGIAGFLASLSKHQGFRKGIQRAGASRTHPPVSEPPLHGPAYQPGCRASLQQTPSQSPHIPQLHGAAILSLLRGAAFLSEGKLDRVIEVAEPAEKDSLTRSLAHQLKLAAFEQQGKTVEADALLDTLVRGDSEDRTRQAFLLLGLVDAGMGIVAVADADIDRLERAAERFIALDKQCARIGLPDAVKSALDLYHYTFSDDVGPAQRPLGIRGDTAAKAKHAMKSRIEGLDEEAKLTLREGLEEFAEAVRLLAIEDPFDAWDEVARLVGSDWPEGLSAEEAVRQIRE